jgi:hypothetical protein
MNGIKKIERKDVETKKVEKEIPKRRNVDI